MSGSPVPPIDRRVPKAAVIVMTIVVYGIAVPLNWVLSKLGFTAALITLMRRLQPKNRWKKVFGGYRPTAHDVFVSTFAKSGTNWMMQIAHQIAFRGDGEYENIHDVVSWPDMDVRRKRKMSIALDDTRIQQSSPTGLRIIKTHLSAHHVPFSKEARYLIVVRDPKEVFVSSYYFAKGPAGPLMPSPELWFDLFVSGRFPLDFGNTWAEHTASYWALRNEPNVLVLTFREMKRDLAAAVGRVADVMGVSLTEAEMSRVIEKSSFSYMKGINDRFEPMKPGTLPWSKGFTMMRRGEAGASHEMLSQRQQRLIDERFRQELADLGSDFPYSELFGTAVTSSGQAALGEQQQSLA
jgi:Sulfotransferase domain